MGPKTAGGYTQDMPRFRPRLRFSLRTLLIILMLGPLLLYWLCESLPVEMKASGIGFSDPDDYLNFPIGLPDSPDFKPTIAGE